MTPGDFFRRYGAVIHVRLSRVRGSSPREAGAEMFVAEAGLWGTIGGGQLEYMAVDKARAMLRAGEDSAAMEVPLGPEIGQCCGGRVELVLSFMSDAARMRAIEAEGMRRDAAPHVYILGAGHVGRALADLFQFLPVRCILVDGRAAELALCAAAVEKRLSVMPEADIRAAPPGSAFIVLTHDHALDFLLAAEALGRRDASYVGLIGSATKRARFERYCHAAAPGLPMKPLSCPIAAGCTGDKRPAVIAAFTTAEVMARLATTHSATVGNIACAH